MIMQSFREKKHQDFKTFLYTDALRENIDSITGTRLDA